MCTCTSSHKDCHVGGKMYCEKCIKLIYVFKIKFDLFLCSDQGLCMYRMVYDVHLNQSNSMWGVLCGLSFNDVTHCYD